jgi:hypothetical protein
MSENGGEEKGDFLRRWSRLKREAAVPEPAPPASAAAAKPPELPPVDSLTFDSDFKAFMHSKVEEGVKRAALKKLFSDPRFNIMDGLDTYIDDYSKEDPIPEAMLATLEHARTTLFGPRKEEAPAAEQEEKPAEAVAAAEVAPTPAAPAAENVKTDDDPRQDPQAL